MSKQKSCSPSNLSNNSSDVRLFERVRLHSFQGLLHGSPGRMRSPGKHPRVLLEDLLKAEVLSSQLILAIEDLVRSLLGMLDTVQEDGEDYGMSSTTEDESIKSFRSALLQSANTLDELTKLQISENGKELKHAPNTPSLFVHNASMVEKNATNGDDESADHRLGKILSYSSDSTTPSSFSARASEFESTSPSDETVGEDDMNAGEENRRNCDMTVLQEAVKTLRNEIQELQAKHEGQFMTFASKFVELDQDDHPNMRQTLEKIMQKLSPQDQNWTFHGRLDEAEMEQLFYFVLLQKTLRSCSAVMNIPTLREFDRKMEHENTQPCENNNVQDGRSFIPSLNSANGLCSNCCQPLRSDNESKEYLGRDNSTTLNIPNHDIQVYNSSDSNEEPTTNGLSKSNLKRPHDFEDEQQHKKRKKGKNLFACFSRKWLKNNKRSKKH
mgnify:CR=1 FL=1